MRTNILLVISKISKVVFFEWLAEYLDKTSLQVTFAIMNDVPTEIETLLASKGYAFYHISYKNKVDLPSAIWKLKGIIKQSKIDVIHAHLLDATLAGMIAGLICGTRKRIFTRHHSNYHHVYNKKGILYDKLCNFLATDIIAITDIVKDYLVMEGVHPKKISLIPHGFKLEEYSQCSEERLNVFKSKYNIPSKQIIIGVVSRYTLWKGIQFIIPAFKEFIKGYPDALLLLANAKGNDELVIKRLLSELPQKNVREIIYERDMTALYHSLTLFVHTPIDRESEAFGQTYIEAMAAGVPCIVTLSGISNNYVIDKENAWIVPFQNSEAILFAMESLASNPELANTLAGAGKKIVERKFKVQDMVTKLEKLYLL